MLRVRRKLLCSVAAVSLLAAQAAFAADIRAPMPVKAPAPVAPAPLWAGWYVGGHAGYSWGSVDGDTTETVFIPNAPNFLRLPNPVAFPALARDVKPDGAVAGIQGGYNFQSARVVYGFEADLSWSGQRGTFGFRGVAEQLNSEDFIYQETLRADLQMMGTVRGRIGYAFGHLLPYVTGGFAFGRMRMQLDWLAQQKASFCPACAPFATASFSGSETRTLIGWTLGAGFEYSLAQKWSVKAEYLFVDLGKETYFSGIQGGGKFGLNDHILRFGLNYHL